MIYQPATMRAFTFALLLLGVSAVVIGGCFRSDESWKVRATLNAALDVVDFNRDIRPILSENCFKCHGPDRSHREADLRLDVNEDWEKVRTFLALRITSTDPDFHMPPPGSGKTLTAAQITLLTRWVDEGASWQPHWAFVPPKRAPGDIDSLVRARLQKEGLKPSSEADRITLIRRVTLDLTGIPPTPEEVDAFVGDGNYEKLIDRLLASPRFGERMAMEWMDVARYADTHGYSIDSGRDMWIWRAWVIDAFNRNQPYDQFIVDQLAGDLLPGATREQRIATGFNRNHPVNFEGGSIEEEFRVEYVVDRVNTTSSAFLGLTMGCARCHDHKYDPIGNDEFYRFFAFFNSIADQGLDGQSGNAAPVLRVYGAAQEKRLAALREQLAKLVERRKAPLPKVDAAQAAWEAAFAKAMEARWKPLDATKVESTGGATLEKLGDGSIVARGSTPDKDVYEIAAHSDLAGIQALRLEALTHDSLPKGGPGRFDGGNFVLSEIEVDGVKLVSAWASYSQSTFDVARAIDGREETGWAVDGNASHVNRVATFLAEKPFDGGELKIRLTFRSPFARHAIGRFRISLTTDPAVRTEMAASTLGAWTMSGPHKAESGKKAWETEVETKDWVEKDFKDGRVHALTGENSATYLRRTVTSKSARAMTVSLGSDDAIKVWVNGVVAFERHVLRPIEPDQDRVVLSLREGENTIEMKVVNYGGGYGFFFRRVDEQPMDLPPEVIEGLTFGNSAFLRDHWRRTTWPEWKGLTDEIATLKREEAQIDALAPTTMVMAELATPRETFILKRGQYDQRGERVAPGTPSCLPPMKDAPLNRLGLARWLIDPAHPLTARVAVNRLWQMLFGVGIVETSEDFGTQGQPPSHPELLDSLACEFAAGWDVKAMMKRIVMSSTYRQSSRASPGLVERDPRNRLLARGPRFRMSAEMVRDNALAAAGLLVEKAGGPGVRPYQPAGLWEALKFDTGDGQVFSAQDYVQDRGEALYRRSVYLFWKRACPPPGMSTFDAPNRDVCTLRRPRTNTPLQALELMNDPVYVEAARALAQAAMKGTTPEKRATIAFRRATGRAPKAAEIAVLIDLYRAQLDVYTRDVEAAKRLLAIGESKRDESLDVREHAAWTVVASLILNLDETITKE